ncbi:Cytosolic carboxypeptidase [Echinococcus granulosus]|uniref:Cytosolic carboxypeptidase n=1 Tax=Echinococcus granulosus TaxID=6210 RepID=W6UEF6_ECHGR|nr:Cytosolic carboxypeptidase [Echinococcus granulosus]EUB56457.1 Cytosolic carboxypeptidase [Echinococcus granulosus]
MDSQRQSSIAEGPGAHYPDSTSAIVALLLVEEATVFRCSDSAEKLSFPSWTMLGTTGDKTYFDVSAADSCNGKREYGRRNWPIGGPWGSTKWYCAVTIQAYECQDLGGGARCDEEKYLLYIVHAGGTRVILQALRAEYSENMSVDELLFKMHKLLCKLAPYDRRFTLRARLSQCIPITVSILRVQIAHLQSFIGPRPPLSRASTTSVTGTTVVNTANNSHGGLCPPPSRRSRRRPSYALRRPSQSRVPSSLAANLRVLLTTLRCYCGRRGRSNSATIGRLGTVNVLLRALALTAGLPHIRRTSTVIAVLNSSGSSLSDEATDGGGGGHNVVRASGAGAVPLLLELFLGLHRYDSSGQLVDLQFLALTSLQMLTDLRAGRRAIVSAGGLFALFSLCASKMNIKVPSTPSLIASKTESKTVSRQQETLPIPSAASLASSSASMSSSSSPSSSRSTLSLATTGEERGLEQFQERHLELVLNGACDLLRRCCPYAPLPIHPAEPILRIIFNNEGQAATLKPPLPGEEGEVVECEAPNETPHHQVRPRRSKSCQQVPNINRNSKSSGSNRVAPEFGKPGPKFSTKVTLCSKKNKKRHKTLLRDSVERKSVNNPITVSPLAGDLLPGVSCSSTGMVAPAHEQSSPSKAQLESTLAALRLEGLVDVLEIGHSSSAGDLLFWDTNVSGNAGGQTKKVVKRFRAKSLQKVPAPSFDSPLKSIRSSRRPEKIQESANNEDDDEEGVEPDVEDDEVVAAVEADLEDDRRCEEEDSSSACATPDMADGLEDVGLAPSLFGLAELMESHGSFFPEWTELPGLVDYLVPPMKESTAESSKDNLYEEMISAAREATSTPSRYLIAARNVRSALDYALRQAEKMVAYPDLINATGPDFCEPLHSPRLHNQTLVPPFSHGDAPDAVQAESGSVISNFVIPLSLDDVRRVVDSEDLIERVVFDLDELITQERGVEARTGSVLSNSDELLLGKFDADLGHLQFESRFESGNLRKVIQVRQTEYDLLLSPDLNTCSHVQWFYFRVANVDSMVRYRFNIINLEKAGSQYSGGMQPVVFSVTEALNGRPYWFRAGGCINYYKNHFMRSGSGAKNSRNYYTATFSLRFQHRGDICYIAYHYPYTHSRLLADLTQWQLRAQNAASKSPSKSSRLYLRVQNLTSTLLDNLVPLVTITEATEGSGKVTNPRRPYIFITARVHPGESNSSWVMRGLLDHLTDPRDPEMVRLRHAYVFKVVPSLNPDGVICGNHRCSMAAKDLNRQWLNPSQSLHPTIFHTKCLINLLAEVGSAPYIYIDLHGHSRMKDIFVYGCDPHLSWKASDSTDYLGVTADSFDGCFLELAEVMHNISLPFSKAASDYSISRVKEATGRVVVWRQFGVARSYTLEASYCGTTRNCWRDEEACVGHQISPWILQNVGASLCKAFLCLDPNRKRMESPFGRRHPGDRVFAKMKGFPFWPARVDPLPPHVELPKGKVPVFFYGTHQVSFLNPKNLVSFDDHKDAYGKRKVLIKAMIEIESDPEILLLGKDPAAEAFWESLYPLEYGKVEREADTIRGRMSRSNSPATKRALKRKASRAPRVHSAKRQRSGDQEDDLISISPISDTVDTNSLQAAEVMGEKKDNRQEKEEDNLQASESVNKRTARKRHHLAVECYDPIENDKRVKEAKLDACFETEKAVVLMEKGGIIGAGSEIDQFGSPEEMAGVMSAEAPSNVFGNIVMLDTVNTQSEEPCNTPESVNVDVEETQELTSFDTTALSSVNEEGYYDITEIVQDSEATENQKSQRNMREGKPRRFVVDLDAESEDEKKYFRRCSRSDDDDEEEEDLDDDYADDDDDYGCVQKPKKSDKQSMYNIKKEEEEEVICNAYRGMKNELASGSEAVDEPIKHSSSSSSERETVSKSSKSGDDEDSYDCKLKGGDISQDRVVEGDDEYICKNNESVDNELMDVSKHLSELRRHSSSEGEASSKSSGNDDFGESVAQNVKSGESAIEEDRERIRRFLLDCSRNWGSEDENRVVRSTKSLDLRRKGGAEGDCISRSFVSGGEVRKKASDSEEDSERVRENLDSWASESPDTFKNIGDHRRPDNDGKDESSRRCSLKNSPRHKAKVPGSADGHSRTKRRGSSGEVELVKRAKHVSSSSSGVAPSGKFFLLPYYHKQRWRWSFFLFLIGVDKLQILHDLTIQLKSNLVRGHEKFDAAVDVLARICATKVSLLQLTKVWELTDCVKKCRKYRLSAQVRDAASRALAYFQRIQAAASKEEVLKAKAIVAERMRLEKSEKPQPPAAAPVATSTAPSNSNKRRNFLWRHYVQS